MLRSLLVGATVFTLAVLTGGLLAGAAPAGPAPPTETSVTDPAGVVTVSNGAPAAHGGDLIFAYSMIYSGAVALALSVAGTVMVARRRRLW